MRSASKAANFNSILDSKSLPDLGNINITTEFTNLQFNIGIAFVWSTANPIYYSSKK